MRKNRKKKLSISRGSPVIILFYAGMSLSEGEGSIHFRNSGAEAWWKFWHRQDDPGARDLYVPRFRIDRSTRTARADSSVVGLAVRSSNSSPPRFAPCTASSPAFSTETRVARARVFIRGVRYVLPATWKRCTRRSYAREQRR